MPSPRRAAAFAHFHDRFAKDPLVLDKWMGLQAGSSLPETTEAVRALMKHPGFDIANPNRVRALIGAFSVNHLRFHRGGGLPAGGRSGPTLTDQPPGRARRRVPLKAGGVKAARR